MHPDDRAHEPDAYGRVQGDGTLGGDGTVGGQGPRHTPPRHDAQPPIGEMGTSSGPPNWKHTLKALAGPFIALGLLVINFGTKALAILKALPFLGTALSMLISMGAWTLVLGWRAAAGFVLLIFVHEMGHVFQLRREGIPASAPMFIPFLGAFVAMKELPRNALIEARVALAGPIIGSLGAFVAYLAWLQSGSILMQYFAFIGFFLNLFNLLPVSPLDGGRAAAAIDTRLWFAGLLAMGLFTYLNPNPVLILILVLGAIDIWHRWRARHVNAHYYDSVTPPQRVAVFVVYVGLAVVLALMMSVTQLPAR